MTIVKKFITSAALLTLATRLALAVYPPSTSMEEPASQPLAVRPTEEIQRFSAVTDRLEEKERVLDGIIQNLQKDEKNLNQKVASPPAKSNPPAEVRSADHAR
jgi:hypothetical protein